MKAIVVYESLWGNTAAVARAIAEGLGSGAQALSTTEATKAAVTDADLIVAGSPVLGFQLPDEKMRANIRMNYSKGPKPPDLSHPTLRSWLKELPQGSGKAAAFETRIWWSLGGATKAILSGLEKSGYSPLSGFAKGERFIVKGTYGPLKEGELERARRWGTELAGVMEKK